MSGFIPQGEIGKDLPLTKPDFTKDVEQLTQITSEDTLKISMYYIIKHRIYGVYGEINPLRTNVNFLYGGRGQICHIPAVLVLKGLKTI